MNPERETQKPSIISTQSTIYEIMTYKVESNRLVLEPNEKIDESLICGICQEVPFRPEECATCQNIFCSECISKWLEKKTKCPFDCPPPYQGTKPHKLIRQALGSLKYRCINQENGCEEIICLDSLAKHEGKCAFAKIKCPFSQECSAEFLRKELEEHEKFCEFVLLKCEKCRFDLNRKELKTHDCILSLREKYISLEKKFEMFKEDNELSIKALSKKIEDLLSLFQESKKPALHESNQSEKLCQRGHELTWGMGNNIKKCDMCKKNDVFSRYACDECGLKYCIYCVYPNLSGQKCPLKHDLISVSNLIWHSCDLCRKGLDKESKAYNDKKCDFDVCGDCYRKASK